MSQKWRMVLDLTWPHSSMMTGFGFNSLIEETFGETNIEDLWLPFFTITTGSLCWGRSREHLAE